MIRRLAVLVSVVAVLGAAGWFGYRSDAMKLQRVEVLGNQNVSADAVVAKSGLRRGQHLLRIDTSRISRDLQEVSWIQDARVERILPSKIRVTVHEREPAAVVQFAQARFIVDRDQVVLDEGAEDLPTITQLPTKQVVVGEKLGLSQLDHIFRILDDLDPSIGSRVDQIEASSVDRITLVLDSGTKILWGAAEKMEDKSFAVTSLLEKYRLESKHVVRLDVRVPLRPAVQVR